MCQKGWDEPAGTKVDASSKGTWIIKNGSNVLLTCTEVTERGTTENTGGAKMAVRWNVEEVNYKGCTKPVKRLKMGWWSFSNSGSSGDATMTAGGAEATAEIFGISCAYGTGESAKGGTFEAGETPTMNVSVTLTKTAGGVFCPATVEMVGQFFTTEPKPLWMPDSSE
jgi:hypothetical protein